MTVLAVALVVVIACVPTRRPPPRATPRMGSRTDSISVRRAAVGPVGRWLLLVVPLSVVGGLIAGSPLLVVTTPIVAGAVQRECRRWSIRRLHRQRLAAILDFAESTATGLRAGGSLSTAVAKALEPHLIRRQATEWVENRAGDPPPHPGLDHVHAGLAAGVPLPVAFSTAFSDASSSSEERLLATVVVALHGSGGSAVDALERVAGTLRDRHAWREDLRTQGQQALSSAAVMSVLPLIFGVGAGLVDGGVAQLYLTRWLGALCAGAGLLLCVLGWEWQQRLLEADR